MKNLDRRTLVRSSVWTAPAIALASAAPAFAASGRMLNWTFRASPVTAEGEPAGTCNDLAITFDNTASGAGGVDLLPTLVVTEAFIFGSWQGQPQENASIILAGQSYTMNTGQSLPANIPLRFRVTFNDASGNAVTMASTEVVTGACGAAATFTHVSTA